MDGWLYKNDRSGNPNVLELEHNDNGLWLDTNWVNPANLWNPDNRLAFGLRKYLFSPLRRGFSFAGFLNSSSIRRAFYLLRQVLEKLFHIVYWILVFLPKLVKLRI